MIVEIKKANPYIVDWIGLLTGENNGKTIFEITEEEYSHFIQNYQFYKVKTKKLFFDEAYKAKVEAQNEIERKAGKILNLKKGLCDYKELGERFKKFNIGTEEIENKIAELEEKLKEKEA